MADTNWIQVGAGLVGGGAVGAIITNLVTAYRSRIQPVGRKVNVLPVFRRSNGTSGLSARVAITHADTTSEFENLFLVELQLINKGNRDLTQFDLGVTLQDGDTCIYVETKTADRHHQARLSVKLCPSEPHGLFDVELKPFNRNDVYAFTLFVVVPTERAEPGEVRLSSPIPVKFIDMPTLAESLSEAAEIALKVGAFTVRFK